MNKFVKIVLLFTAISTQVSNAAPCGADFVCDKAEEVCIGDKCNYQSIDKPEKQKESEKKNKSTDKK